MPEVYLTTKQSPSTKANSRSQVKGRPRCPSQKEVNWLGLPHEIWLEILNGYSLSVADLVHVEQTCSFFGGYGLTEEAARLTMKRYRDPRFGQMCARINGSWKKRLHTIDQLSLHYTQLASGSYQNVFSSGNRVFTWGAGRFGQLGNGGQDDCATLSDITDYIPPEMGRVVQVSASSAHTAVLTNKGMTFMFGDSRYDQLGQGNYDASVVPLLVRGNLSNIHCVQVACGSSHTMILSDMGQVYVTGKGDTGQLGLGRSVKYCHGPTLLPVEADIKYITAGIAHNVLITNNGGVFTFGSGTGGQLGLGGTKDVYQPSMVVANFQDCMRDGKHEVITSAAAGVDHTLFLNNKGKVFSCGRNRDGTLGLGHTKITVVPRMVEKLQNNTVDNVVAGVGMSIFITEQGSAYWCGEGVESLEKKIALFPTELHFPDKLKAASIGDDHIIILTRSGKLFSMGANTRGQTGHSTNGLSVNNFTEIALPI